MVGPLRTLPLLGLFTVLLVLLIVLSMPHASAEVGNGASYPKRSSSAIALTVDGTILLVVNPDSNTLTLVDSATSLPMRELDVGVDPRAVTVDDAGQRAYVTNWGSGSVSVVDLVNRTVITEANVGHRPYGIAVSPDGARSM